MARKRSTNLAPLAVPAAILLVAAAVRGVGLGRAEFWHDEYCSLLMLAAPDGILTAAASGTMTPDGGNPPLYYLLLKAWTAVFGLSEAGVRSLSLVLGIGQIAVMGALVRALGAARRAAWTTMGVATVASVNAFYAVEARAYSLLLFLLTFALWQFFRAVRRGDARSWVLHGAALALATYTHNLAVPFAAAFWGTAAVLRVERGAWIRLAATHAAVALLYVPWLPVVLTQSQSATHDWIRAWWSATPQALLIPRSLEVLGIGGRMPAYLDLPAVPGWIRWGSVLAMASASLAAFLPRRGGSRLPPRIPAALAVFVLAPLLFLIVYSNAKSPLYLVGRYDLPAQVAWLAVLGIGFDRLLARFGRPAWIAAVAAGAVLSFFAQRDWWERPSLLPADDAGLRRGAVLAARAGPDDVILCTGFTTTGVLFELFRHGAGTEVVTFPRALRSHVGWYNPDQDLARGEDTLRAEARQLLDRMRERPGATLWLVTHVSPVGGPHARIMELLLETLAASEFTPAYPPGRERELQALGITPVTRAGT